MTIEQKGEWITVRDNKGKKIYKGKDNRIAEFKYMQGKKQEEEAQIKKERIINRY